MVEPISWEFYLDELDDSVGEEEDYGGVVDVVYKSNTAETDVKEVLTVVVLENFGQILFAKLWLFEHSQDTNERGQEGSKEGKADIEGTNNDKYKFERSFHRIRYTDQIVCICTHRCWNIIKNKINNLKAKNYHLSYILHKSKR